MQKIVILHAKFFEIFSGKNACHIFFENLGQEILAEQINQHSGAKVKPPVFLQLKTQRFAFFDANRCKLIENWYTLFRCLSKVCGKIDLVGEMCQT